MVTPSSSSSSSLSLNTSRRAISSMFEYHRPSPSNNSHPPSPSSSSKSSTARAVLTRAIGMSVATTSTQQYSGSTMSLKASAGVYGPRLLGYLPLVRASGVLARGDEWLRTYRTGCTYMYVRCGETDGPRCPRSIGRWLSSPDREPQSCALAARSEQSCPLSIALFVVLVLL